MKKGESLGNDIFRIFSSFSRVQFIDIKTINELQHINCRDGDGAR
jgi:hypothetical protein